jgi:hypothetical protein
MVLLLLGNVRQISAIAGRTCGKISSPHGGQETERRKRVGKKRPGQNMFPKVFKNPLPLPKSHFLCFNYLSIAHQIMNHPLIRTEPSGSNHFPKSYM